MRQPEGEITHHKVTKAALGETQTGAVQAWSAPFHTESRRAKFYLSRRAMASFAMECILLYSTSSSFVSAMFLTSCSFQAPSLSLAVSLASQRVACFFWANFDAMTQVAAQLGRDHFSRPVWLYGPHPLQWKWPLWCSLGSRCSSTGCIF